MLSLSRQPFENIEGLVVSYKWALLCHEGGGGLSAFAITV